MALPLCATFGHSAPSRNQCRLQPAAASSDRAVVAFKVDTRLAVCRFFPQASGGIHLRFHLAAQSRVHLAVAECGPGLRPDNAVRNQAVVALELPHRGFGLGAEYAVHFDTDPLLDFLD